MSAPVQGTRGLTLSVVRGGKARRATPEVMPDFPAPTLERGPRWCPYHIDGRPALYIVDALGNWRGHVIQQPGESVDSVERRAWDALDAIDPE